MTKISAVVFDMDGVLVDAREWHYIALNRALELFGYTIPREEHLLVYDGLPTRRKLEVLSSKSDLPISLHEFVNHLKQIYTVDLIHRNCKPTFRHERALKELKKQGYKLGLASNSISATIQLMMEKTSLLHYFDEVISADQVTNGKPDPEIYTKIFDLLEINPKNILVVEDNENGIQGALSAGANVLKVLNPDDVTFELIAKEIDRLEK